MTQSTWLHILIAISGVPSLIIFFYIAIRDKSLSRLAFGAAITAYLVGITLSYTTNIKIGLTQEWGNLVAITLTLCALFIIIRNSKPVFARFPIYMTAMPLLGLIFYPIINDAVVVKELLMIIYEGGALLVGLLVIGINQFMLKNRGVLLISILILAFSYSLYWFIDTNKLPIQEPLSITLFSIGVLLSSIGFKYISDKEKEI